MPYFKAKVKCYQFKKYYLNKFFKYMYLIL